ncbi:MAG: hypothetical protein ACT4P4_10890 [Betaproteobacteria bacterium]
MKVLLSSVMLLALAGCASAPPNTPAVLVLPGTGKSWDTFRFDDHECRQYAGASVGSTPDGASADAGLKSAVVGTAVGAAAGGLMGGNAGAGVGAGVGLATGALAGSGAANASSRTLQHRYDHGYQQCMYAKGHKIPMAPEAAARERSSYRAASRPPPPPGRPPPPPPDFKVN